jgi:hypothetical protein
VSAHACAPKLSTRASLCGRGVSSSAAAVRDAIKSTPSAVSYRKVKRSKHSENTAEALVWMMLEHCATRKTEASGRTRVSHEQRAQQSNIDLACVAGLVDTPLDQLLRHKSALASRATRGASSAAEKSAEIQRSKCVFDE